MTGAARDAQKVEHPRSPAGDTGRARGSAGSHRAGRREGSLITETPMSIWTNALRGRRRPGDQTDITCPVCTDTVHPTGPTQATCGKPSCRRIYAQRRQNLRRKGARKA